MSTRAMYSFYDQTECHHVYKHSDGYPEGALDVIAKARLFAWPIPRFEPDEFAGAFCTAGKLWHTYLPAVEQIGKIAAKRASDRDAGKDVPNFYGDQPTLIKFDRTPNGFNTLNGGLGGNIRLMGRTKKPGQWKTLAPWDIAYRYEISLKNNRLHVAVYEMGGSSEDIDCTLLREGEVDSVLAWAVEEARIQREAYERERAEARAAEEAAKNPQPATVAGRSSRAPRRRLRT